MSTKPSHALTMRDRMSHLSFEGACKLLGPRGKRLLLEGGALELEAPEDLRIDEREAVVVWDKSDASRSTTARLVLEPASRAQLRAICTSCDGACLHVGGLLAHVLENKSGLGLAEPPAETELRTFGDDDALVEAAIAERRRNHDDPCRTLLRGGLGGSSHLRRTSARSHRGPLGELMPVVLACDRNHHINRWIEMHLHTRVLASKPAGTRIEWGDPVAPSPGMRQLFEQIREVAPPRIKGAGGTSVVSS